MKVVGGGPRADRRAARTGTATPSDFVDAAMAILASDGHRALTLSALCARVGVSTGSFYHHFTGLDGFVAVLLDGWESSQLDSMRVASRVVDRRQRVGVAKQLAGLFDHRAEAGIRAWSLADPTVAEVQQRVDAERRSHLTSLLAATGIPRAQARVLATTGLALLVGTQLLGEGPTRIQEVLDVYEDLVLRAIPPQGD